MVTKKQLIHSGYEVTVGHGFTKEGSGVLLRLGYVHTSKVWSGHLVQVFCGFQSPPHGKHISP